MIMKLLNTSFAISSAFGEIDCKILATDEPSKDNLIEEVPLASYYELVPHRDYILKYKIYDLNIETSNFYNVITACVNYPLAVKSKGIFREEVNNVCSFGHTIDTGIFQDELVVINYNGTTVYYLTKDILGLWKEMMG